jgi:hypothetical protein
MTIQGLEMGKDITLRAVAASIVELTEMQLAQHNIGGYH